MSFTQRWRLPALGCALAVFLCTLLINPRVEMGIGDDAPYVRSAQILAATGHIVYTGWSTAMIGWQLYFAALLIHLFGFSFTLVHLTSAITLAAVACVFQRTLVLARISEGNAALGSLALALCPLCLMLSATFMTDLGGLLAIVCCLYGCLFALRSRTDVACVSGLFVAVFSNLIFGTSRQIAWLGVLVMVPLVLWLLRARGRRILLTGAAFVVVADCLILLSLHWLNQQPFSIPEHLVPARFSLVDTYRGLTSEFFDIPFLLLGLATLWIPLVRRAKPLVRVVMVVVAVGLPLVTALHHIPGSPHLEPTGGSGSWLGTLDTHPFLKLAGVPPPFLSTTVQILLTICCFAAVCGLVAVSMERKNGRSHPEMKEFAFLFGPYSIAYALLLVPRATELAPDRYMLGLLPGAILLVMRVYQDRVRSAPPRLAWAGLVLTAFYGVTVTHNMCALFRARVAMAAQLQAQGVPDTSVDNGWEYNFWVELQHAPSINDERIVRPAGFYHPVPEPPDQCRGLFLARTPHIHPLYAISFDSNACYGPTTFPAVAYSRWLAKEGKLFVVRANPSLPAVRP